MDLRTAEALLEIASGGPGSGRHAGIHEYLSKKGWQSTTGNGYEKYEHPGLAGHSILVQPNGKWVHNSPTNMKRGDGKLSLAWHMQKPML